MTSQEFDKRAMKDSKGRVGNISTQKLVETTTKDGKPVVGILLEFLLNILISQVPAHQLIESFHWKRWYNVIPQQSNSSFFQSDQNTMDFNILPGDRHLTKALLSFTLTCANSSVTVAPLYLCFKWLEWFGNGGGQRICQLYGDILHWVKALIVV
jgi:hypothetical protein